MNEFIPTQISTDGLRYKSRPSGSPFGPNSGASLSCYKCGQHKSRNLGTNRVLCGKKMFGCFDCYPPAAS
jgi:hypothetical protein